MYDGLTIENTAKFGAGFAAGGLVGVGAVAATKAYNYDSSEYKARDYQWNLNDYYSDKDVVEKWEDKFKDTKVELSYQINYIKKKIYSKNLYQTKKQIFQDLTIFMRPSLLLLEK